MSIDRIRCSAAAVRWSALGRGRPGRRHRARRAGRRRRRCWPIRRGPGRSGWGRARSSETMAWPTPLLVASSGASFPPGRVCRPQVLATSMTAVVPSNAAMVGRSWPVAPATVMRMRRNPDCDGGLDAAVSAVGERQPGVLDPAFGEPVAQVLDHLGGGEAALELVRCQENLHDLFSSSSAVTAVWVLGWVRGVGGQPLAALRRGRQRDC